MTTTLILGGARSGKSARAQALVEAKGAGWLYIATAEALDAEMAERIAYHRADRGPIWRTIEAPLDLVSVLEEGTRQEDRVLVDCLTLWLSNLMHHERDVEAEGDRLCVCLQTFKSEIVLVSNEVGLGLVPDTSLGRRFRDAQGRLNQKVATVCDVVEFVAAGLPLRLKG